MMPESDLKVRKRIYRAELGAYLLIVSIAVFGFWQIGETQDDVCQSVIDNRAVTQNLVIAIDRLGTNLISDGKPDDKLTPDQLEAIDRFAAFRDEQLAKLQPTPC